jgi:restriction system protein
MQMTVMIWLYERLRTDRDKDLIEPRGSHGELTRLLKSCAYCCAPLRRIGPAGFPESALDGTALSVRVCDQCGWWTVERTDGVVLDRGSRPARWLSSTRYAWGCLKPLDVSDLHVPLDELRSYLIAKYGERFHLNPRRFEHVVASVFSDSGYRVRVTSFSGDDGIDVVALDGPDDTLVGIQVKRYRGKIDAEQIRTFGGALVLGGITKGIFVTTSTFTKGAKTTASQLELRGFPIQLEDASRFYDRMRIASRPGYNRAEDPGAPFSELLQDGAEYYAIMPNKGWI